VHHGDNKLFQSKNRFAVENTDEVLSALCIPLTCCCLLQTTQFIRRVISPVCILLYNSDVDIFIIKAAGADSIHFSTSVKDDM